MRGPTVLQGCLGLVMVLGGCATVLVQTGPHPDRPEISAVRLETDRVRSGCPVKLRVAFRDAGANIARIMATWSYVGMAGLGGQPTRIAQDGFASVPLDRAVLAGKGLGEAEIVLTPLQPGAYHYAVQVEDGAGHRSNVVEQSFTIVSHPTGQPIPCDQPVR